MISIALVGLKFERKWVGSDYEALINVDIH